MSVSREEVEQIKEWAIAAASGHPVLIEEPAEKVALICCRLLAADDALKQIASAVSLIVDAKGGTALSHYYALESVRSVARAAMLPSEEVGR